jgi:regulator of RNase E activity RraA
MDSEQLSNRLEKCYTGAVYDVMRAMGYPHQGLPEGILPLEREWKVAGEVFTVSGHIVPSLDPHETLLCWTGMLSKAPKGSVVVCQPNDSSVSHMGELSAETFKYRGVRGYIVDGGCRDTAFITRLGFRVFCRYVTPVDVVGRWKAETFNEPICMGGVTIHPGDFVFGDRDGVVLIPRDIVEDVVTRTEEVMQTENKVRTMILHGGDPQEAYLQYGKF